MSVLAALLFAATTAPATPAASAGLTPAAGTAPVSVTATASKREVTVGEPFTVELKATGPAGTAYTFAGEASGEALELRTPARADAGAAPELGTHRYEAAVFALGEVQLPPIPVRYRLPDGTRGEAASAPLALKVVSLLPKDAAQQKLADIRGPESVTIGSAFWIALTLALLLVSGLVTWLVRRRRGPRKAPLARVPELAPDVEAQRALDALAADGLLGRGELRLFYIRLTAVAKGYLERRLRAPILEMTTAETLALLRGHRHGAELLAVVRDLAEAADRIKFAKGQGLVQEAERHLASVRGLVQALELRLRPAPSASGAEGKAA
jgi:hypothetical protein